MPSDSRSQTSLQPPPLTSLQSHNVCEECNSSFGLLKRKRNCGNCGRVVCFSCSPNSLPLPQFGQNTPQRVCSYCEGYIRLRQLPPEGLKLLPISVLKQYLAAYGLPVPRGALEKEDLVKVVRAVEIDASRERWFRDHIYIRGGRNVREGSSSSNRGASSPSSPGQPGRHSDGEAGFVENLGSFLSNIFGGLASPEGSNQNLRPNESAESTSRHRSRSQPPPMHQQPPPQGFNSSSHGRTSHPAEIPLTPEAIFASLFGMPPTTSPGGFSGGSGTQPQYGAPFGSYPTQGTQPDPFLNPNGPQSRHPAPPPRAASTEPTPSIASIASTNLDPSALSSKTLKAILRQNAVSCDNVLEKGELVERVKALAREYRREHRLSEPPSPGTNVTEPSTAAGAPLPPVSGDSTTSSPLSVKDEDLCKICCDGAVNTVFLECGHMATCVSCANKLMSSNRECPMCRQYITRVVHTFKS
ncbi:hypothetical protein M427DRAFT_434882 [Gonapodya prolifera JEL478]|uniref:RING-type domain-containing protein n=1 Tax=Gonapodya prolifera (strain JEL478) TaxID=1344416 RepID=A0A139A544_GONPJ|nr:hypothetical protein M427DRAFT_434882 [Gonapodya prolifera JEL478]|eukprot:KXS11513.1 hypothetical protein M427DRAFT_434882 [Gonapodya prolifera JEL478]